MNETGKLWKMLTENSLDPFTASAIVSFAKENKVTGEILEILEDYGSKSKIRKMRSIESKT